MQFDPWQIEFLEATGQMIVNDTGGVYLVDDTGVATRVSTGDLVFNGPNHFVVRECDEHARVHARPRRPLRPASATSSNWVHSTSTGMGDPSSTSISPDGTALSYFDWHERRASCPPRIVFDLTTGNDVKVVSADQYNVETAWAADSSGMFLVVDRAIVFHDRATGEQIPITADAGLDDIIAVAARPITG